MTATMHSGRRRPSRGAPLLAVWLGIGLIGCDSLVEVDNPNNVGGEDVLNPTASTAVSNGALYTVQEGYSYMLAPFSTASDELTWIGSRDAWQELDLGTPENALNEFTDGAFPFFAQGLWMSNEAIKILEGHNTDGTLAETDDLARAYLWGAIGRTTTSNWFDDMTFSDRKESGPPIGPASMNSLYTVAQDWLTKGLALVAGDGSDLERDFLAWRAVTTFSAGVWGQVGTVPISVTNTGLVTSAAAATEALAALAADGSDWEFQLVYTASTVWNDTGWQVNNRLELAFGRDYVIPEGDDTIRDRSAANRGILLVDPITGTADMRLDAIMTPFEDGDNYPEVRVTTAREMHLIIAENALAGADMPTFTARINILRDLDGLTNWVDGGAGMPTARDLLIHERRVNLFLMGRRLNDLYRFGQQSSNWQASRAAVTTPGTFLPITKTELDANCHLNPEFNC